MINWFFIQSLAIIALLFFVISYHIKTRKNILIFHVLSLIFWIFHYYFLNAWTGLVLISFNLVVTVLFLFKNKFIWTRSNLILYLSLLILTILTIFKWEGFYSIFALFAVIFILTAKWQDNPNLIRIVSIFASIFWIIYDIFVGSYGGILSESIIILSILISLRDFFRRIKM